MRRVLPPGKLPPALLRDLLARAAAPCPELRLGPALGEDACAIDVPAGALVVASDPITLTGSEVGRHAVLINANDVAVTGVRPRWFLAVVLLPPGTAAEELAPLFDGMRSALDRVGAVLVGGHSEVTEAVSQPVVVGQMLGLAEDGHFVATGSLEPGDAVVQVGEAPIEGAGVLAHEAADRLGALPEATLERARRALHDPGISVVEPALEATRLGARSLHDPTEGGIAAGLHEMAEASGVALRLESERVLWFEPALAICEALGADPWAVLASGTLLAGFPAERAEAACSQLARRGWPAAVIARAEPGRGVRRTDGEALPWPERDEVARLLAG